MQKSYSSELSNGFIALKKTIFTAVYKYVQFEVTVLDLGDLTCVKSRR